MFFLSLCLFGTVLAAPAILEAPLLPGEAQVLVSPYITYAAPILPQRVLEINFEPAPKEENAEAEAEPPEPPAAPEPSIPQAPKPIEPVVVKLEVPTPPSFISNWFSSLPISLPNFSLPSFIGDWFRPTSNPAKLMYPAYYTGYPGAVIVEAPKLTQTLHVKSI